MIIIVKQDQINHMIKGRRTPPAPILHLCSFPFQSLSDSFIYFSLIFLSDFQWIFSERRNQAKKGGGQSFVQILKFKIEALFNVSDMQESTQFQKCHCMAAFTITFWSLYISIWFYSDFTKQILIDHQNLTSFSVKRPHNLFSNICWGKSVLHKNK